ncbi:MAG: T9SS type A sorting domain-containing protein [Chitinophagales bacterium]|nr:T9SS type A sorting domain-containing protein [Chitinophagales bacterium]
MKSFLTFMFLWATFILSAQNNQGIIKVNVENGCGQLFTEQVTIDLYKYTTGSAELVGSSSENPAEFSDLDSDAYYKIEVSSSAKHDKHVSIKDLHVMKAIILGLYPMSIASGKAGRVFDDWLYFSTLDFVILSRQRIGLEDRLKDTWFFVDQETDAVDSIKFGNLANDYKELTFDAFKHGAVASTLPDFCDCTDDDTTSVASVLLPDIEVKAGEEVVFDLIYQGGVHDIGLVFSMQYQDGELTVISSESDVIFNHIQSSQTLHILYYYDPYYGPNLPTFKIAKIRFLPHRNGALSSFFKLNPDFQWEVAYEEANCLKSYHSLVLDVKGICDIIWPPVLVILPDCDPRSDYQTGEPTVGKACTDIVYFTYKDYTIMDQNQCNKTIRAWSALNISTGDRYSFTQIIIVDKDYPIVCGNYTVLLTNGTATIHASDLIKSSKKKGKYSFSQKDASDTIRVLTNTLPLTELLTVYDLEDTTYCIASVTKLFNGCADPILVNKSVTLSSQGSNYVLKAEAFDAGNANHCLGAITDFEYKSPITGQYTSVETFPYKNYKGSVVRPVALRYKVNGSWWVHPEYVEIYFKDDNQHPPLELRCYDDLLTKGVPHDIAFFSSNFENIYGIQGALQLENANIVSTKKIKLSEIEFNEKNSSLKFVWFSPTARTYTDRDTLFVLKVLPTQDAYVSDIIRIADDLLQSEAVLDNLSSTKINLLIRFDKRTATEDHQQSKDLVVYPNPSTSGHITIMAEGWQQGSISIYDGLGQLVQEETHKSVDGTFHISMPENLSNGLYIIRLSDKNAIRISKVLLIR